MKAHWIILQDFTDALEMPRFNARNESLRFIYQDRGKESKSVAIWGPRSSERPPLDDLPLEFLIADDDGYVYYMGRADAAAEFEPLDMYGAPNAGATTIAYKEGRKWVAL